MASFISKLAFALLTVAAHAEVSTDGSCGVTGAGGENAYTCPGDIQCCAASGWCGSTEAHCLTTVGCQADYSNSTEACTEPVPGTTISPDGTCGTEGAGEYGYVCPTDGDTCCSSAQVLLKLWV